jgi:hypothetical protein
MAEVGRWWWWCLCGVLNSKSVFCGVERAVGGLRMVGGGASEGVGAASNAVEGRVVEAEAGSG